MFVFNELFYDSKISFQPVAGVIGASFSGVSIMVANILKLFRVSHPLNIFFHFFQLSNSHLFTKNFCNYSDGVFFSHFHSLSQSLHFTLFSKTTSQTIRVVSFFILFLHLCWKKRSMINFSRFHRSAMPPPLWSSLTSPGWYL